MVAMIKGGSRLLRYFFVACSLLAVASVLFMPKSFAKEPGKVHVLFVGNSLTHVNDLPGMIVELAASRHILVEYDMYAPGGYTLFQHASAPALRDKINKGIWDFVVLQEQSQRPAFMDQWLEAQVFVHARKLGQMIKASNPQARVVFYVTMAKKNGDPMNAVNIPETGTYEGMQKRINAGYVRMAEQNHGLLAPVGFVWKNVRVNRPEVNIYADDTHPNLAGTYLAACTFYSVLFKDSPMGLPHPKGIDDELAKYLQKMTAWTVQGRSWDMGGIYGQGGSSN